MKHENNFDLLRFVLAFIVFLVHAHVLSQRPELSALSSTLSTDVAIRGFFVISGYLVLMSYDNSASLRDYFEKRIRRVYPAYALLIIASGLVGAFLTTLPLLDYAAHGLLPYWIANLAFLNFVQPNLPGVFTGNPVAAVNGALWTLKIEVLFYAALPLIAAAIRSHRRWIVYVLLYASSLAYRSGMLELHNTSGDDLVLRLSRQLPGQLVYFTVGMALYSYRDRFMRYRYHLLAAAAVFYLVKQKIAMPALEPLALGVIIIYLATGIRYLGNFGRFGDLSYGVYIYHFPILQILIGAGWFEREPSVALVAATTLVLGCAYLSWHLVEKRWLKKSSHYVVAADQPKQPTEASAK